jgi:hypothetical protein
MKPKVVICGSFRRDSAGLAKIFRELEATGCRILSPFSLDFADNQQMFVRTSTEADFSVADIEAYHLRAIRDADFIWLHAPAGYIGASAAFELGYALAWRKPVLARELPADEMLRTQVLISSSVFEALELLGL